MHEAETTGDVRAVRGHHRTRAVEAGGARWPAQLALLLLLLGCAGSLLSRVPTPALRVLVSSHVASWVPLSVLVVWRWSWALLHWLRAAVYRYWAYPRLRSAAARATSERGPVPEVAVLLATYKER